jgi:nitronate monooxygenase
MNVEPMPKLYINELEVAKPIIQGGMGVGVSLSGLASAVANEGGIGVISSVGIGLLGEKSPKMYRAENQKAFQREIHKARLLSNGVLGVNIMVAVSDYDDLVKIAYEEEIDIIFLGAGLPLKFNKEISDDKLKNARTKVGVIVSSGRAAQIIFQSWQKNFNHVPDLVVVEGPMAGGHLGFKREHIDHPGYTLKRLLPDVLEVIRRFEEQFEKNIPVIAAGGIYTGGDICDMLALGAQGVQLGTRFVATHECDASLEFKESYINCRQEDLRIIQSPVGMPGRAIYNKFLAEVTNGERKPFDCPWKCLKTCNYREAPYCIARALVNAQQGILDEGYTFAGANAYRVKEIVSVKQVFSDLANEYQECLEVKSRMQFPEKQISAA